MGRMAKIARSSVMNAAQSSHMLMSSVPSRVYATNVSFGSANTDCNSMMNWLALVHVVVFPASRALSIAMRAQSAAGPVSELRKIWVSSVCVFTLS